jgi:TBC1 domain family member 13
MTRILYIYSKLNPKVQYVQGMNEILAPIFYLVNVTKPADQVEEAACFFMFNNAICDILELHIKDLDKSRNGIYGKLNEVNEMLLVIDPQVWKRMDSLKIDPFFYCFRWVTLLYAQDFALFDTMRIWESIFSAQERCLYINLFAIAIILACKDVILEN